MSAFLTMQYIQQVLGPQTFHEVVKGKHPEIAQKIKIANTSHNEDEILQALTDIETLAKGLSDE